MNSFSVLTSVYHNDRPEFVDRALASITACQTTKPDEIVIVVDGPVSAGISNLLNKYRKEYPGLFNIIRLPQNKGLGNALRIGVESVKTEIIARMDSDDIAVANRFDKQLAYLESHKDCDIVGGQITEFIGNENNIVGKREVPCSNEDIYNNINKRCPFNHMTVMFRKASVLDAGNYVDWHYNEDYYLWIRMAETGCQFANLPDTLVNVRVGTDMYRRRGGWRYFKSEAKLQKYMLSHKIMVLPRFLYNVAGRFVIQVAIPAKLRGYIFRKLFRK